MLKLRRTPAALVIILALCTSLVCTGFCAEGGLEESEAVGAEDIIADSVIFYTGFNRLLKYGEVFDIEKTSNAYQKIGDDNYAELSRVCELFDLTYVWDGKTSSLVFKQNETGETFSVKCTSPDDGADGEKTGLFLGSYTYVPVETICESSGRHFYKCADFWAASKSYDLENIIDDDLKAKLTDSGKTVEVLWDFESDGPETKPFYQSGCSAETFAEPCQKFTEDGNTYLQIGATSAGNGGLQLPYVKYDKAYLYTVEFDASKSTDFAGSSMRLYIHAYKDGSFVSYVDGSYSTPKGANDWTHYSLPILPEKVPAGTTDIVVIPAVNITAGADAAGKVMFDNIKVISYPNAQDGSVTPNITTDKAESWYILGETITMTPQNKIDEAQYPQIAVDIYNSFDELVHSETVKTADFNNGYKWTPTEQGFYGYDFFTINSDGIREDLNEFIVKKDTKLNKDVKIYSDRNTVVVAAHETKPMEERSDRLAISMDSTLILDSGRAGGFQGNQIEIADLVGFKKMRFHFLRPDGRAYAQKSLSNPARGQFDFSEWDASVEHAKKYGFELILNLMGVPRYAVPHRTGVNTPEGYPAMSYMPVDIEAWRAFVEYAVNRYKDDCRIWEIWNEPNVYGGSTFWHGITPDYAKIQQTAYDVVKKYQPGDQSEVLLGGIGTRYTNFYEELVQTDAYDAYDLLPLHGFDVNYATLQNIAKDYGREPKRICSTEMHMMLRDRTSAYVYNTEKEEAQRLLLEFLKDFKYGAEFTTFFQIYTSCDIEWVRYVKEHGLTDGSLEGGLYNVGHKQPRFAAIALNTFFETVGKQYDYADEYLLANNKQNVVRVNSDGKDQLIVWNVGGSKGMETLLSKQITDAAAEDFRIIDWEGHVVDVSDLSNITIKPETMYFISGLNSDALDLIESAQGEDEYTGKVLYNATERQKTDTTLLLSHPVADGGGEPLFDKETFTLKNNINYVEDGWYWVANAEGAQQGDFNAKYALSVAEDGMYLVVKVNDASDFPDAASEDTVNLADSIQFAFDTAGDRSSDGYMECYAGLVYGSPVVYKKKAPYIGGDMIPDFIGSENVIENALCSRTVEGTETTYKVFLPKQELYPYIRDLNNALHFTVLANQNDGSGNIGFLEWASGTGSEKDPVQYGDVYLDAESAKESGVYYPPFAKGNNKPLFDLNTLEYADDIEWITDDKFNYVRLIADDPGFKSRTAVGITDEGVYLAAEVEDAEISAGGTSAGNLWQVDSMQFAIDVDARGVNANRFEFQFGKLLDGSVALKKDAAPYFTDAAKPEGYSNSGTVLTNCVTDVSAADGKIVYKAFIPISELYPLKPSDNEIIKMSFLFNQNKGGQRIGYTEWSSGIGASKNAREYGIVRYK